MSDRKGWYNYYMKFYLQMLSLIPKLQPTVGSGKTVNINDKNK